MSADLTGQADLLARARALYTARDYPALAEALASLEPAALMDRPDLGFLLADSWRRIGESERALELARKIEPACTRRGSDRLRRNRLNLEGMLLFERGAVPEAETRWRELLADAARAGDEEFVARANNNLGVIYTLRGRREEALTSYARAIAAYHRLGHRRGLAQAHLNLGITYGELGFAREADAHFRRAMAYARLDGSEDEVARTEQERALLFCFRGDPRLGTATAQRALARFTRLGDPGGQALAHRVLGVAALAEGRHADAHGSLHRALEMAQQVRDALLEAETLMALASVERLRGDDEAATALEKRASALFADLGATTWGEQVRARLRALTDGAAHAR